MANIISMKRFIFLILISLLIIHAESKAMSYNDSIPSGKNFEKALFRMWHPDGLKYIRGIIILMPGSNGDGRNAIEDAAWQKLAVTNDFALIGCYYTDRQHPYMDIEEYADVNQGSGQALLDAIAHFAGKSDHMELTRAPLLLWGHSAGGEFNFEFACWKPEMVIAFVVNKGGYYYTAVAPAATRNVPGLFFTGEKDLEARKDIVKGLFSMNRRAGALWTFAEAPGAGHEVGETQKLAIIFFEECIKKRLKGPAQASEMISDLSALSPDSGLTGDNKTLTLVKHETALKLNYPVSWLISRRFADSWLAFLKKLPL
jgi:pimeloyl-ACP methyl ester carboxylesterase